MHLGIVRDDVQDTADTFGIVLRPRFGNDFDGFHRVGRQASQDFFRIVAHQGIRLSVDVYLEVARTVYLDVVFSVYGHQGNFAEHFQGRIRF